MEPSSVAGSPGSLGTQSPERGSQDGVELGTEGGGKARATLLLMSADGPPRGGWGRGGGEEEDRPRQSREVERGKDDDRGRARRGSRENSQEPGSNPRRQRRSGYLEGLGVCTPHLKLTEMSGYLRASRQDQMLLGLCLERDKQMSQGRGGGQTGGRGRREGLPQEEGERGDGGFRVAQELRLLPHRAGSPPLLCPDVCGWSLALFFFFWTWGRGREAGAAPHRLWALCTRRGIRILKRGASGTLEAPGSHATASPRLFGRGNPSRGIPALLAGVRRQSQIWDLGSFPPPLCS